MFHGIPCMFLLPFQVVMCDICWAATSNLICSGRDFHFPLFKFWVCWCSITMIVDCKHVCRWVSSCLCCNFTFPWVLEIQMLVASLDAYLLLLVCVWVTFIALIYPMRCFNIDFLSRWYLEFLFKIRKAAFRFSCLLFSWSRNSSRNWLDIFCLFHLGVEGMRGKVWCWCLCVCLRKHVQTLLENVHQPAELCVSQS